MNLQDEGKLKKHKKIFITAARFLLITAVIYYILNTVDFSAVYTGIIKADHIFLFLAFILLPLNVFLQYYKWKLSCNYFLDTKNSSAVWRSLFIGFSAAVFTPARSGEYIGRGIVFRDKKLIDITSAVFFDKLFTLFFVILAGIAGAFYFYGPDKKFLYYFFILIVIIFVLLIIYSLVKRNINSKLIYKLKNLSIAQWVLGKISSLKYPDEQYSYKMLLFSFLFYCCYILQFALLISAFTINNNIILYITLAGIIMFVKTMVPNFISGELGIRETASVFFLSAAGEEPAAGFNASIFLFLINIALPSLAGIYFLLKRQKYV